MSSDIGKQPLTSLLKAPLIVVFLWLVFELLTAAVLPDHYNNTAHVSYLWITLFEVLSLLFVMLIWLSLVGSLALSLVYTALVYATFLLINKEKIAVFSAVFMPQDVSYAYQLLLAWDTLKTYLPYLLAGMFLVVLISVVARRFFKQKMAPRWRLITGFLLVGVLLTSWAFKQPINHFLWSKGHRINSSNMLVYSKQKGLLNLFLLNALFPFEVEKPQGYSAETIQHLVNKYTDKQPLHAAQQQPNVIIFFSEAFTDPLASGLKTTKDPIPHFRALSQQHQSGYVSVPVIGGKSANSEFELLTGMSMRFVQQGAIPYIEYINHPIKALPSLLQDAGYITHAVHVASLSFFNYRQAYPFMGFEHVSTLANEDVALDVAGRYPSDEALVDKIIAIEQNSDQPVFVFTFPNSTHGFWNYPGYEHSSLQVTDETWLKNPAEVNTYINALNTTDLAMKKLTDHFQTVSRPTLILLTGDHYPGLLDYLKVNLRTRLSAFIKEHNIDTGPNKNNPFLPLIKRDHPALFFQSQHRVPYVLWSNQQATHGTKDLSMNLMHTEILKHIDHPPEPFYELTRQLADAFGEVSLFIRHQGGFHQQVPDPQQLIRDYHLFQYDVLHGNHFHKDFNLQSEPP